jgi:hypothetical protein
MAPNAEPDDASAEPEERGEPTTDGGVFRVRDAGPLYQLSEPNRGCVVGRTKSSHSWLVVLALGVVVTFLGRRYRYGHAAFQGR